MDDLELRIGALETLAIAMVTVLTPGQLQAIGGDLREGMAGKGEPGYGSDEQTMRVGALGLLEDGMRRHEGFTGGILIPRPPLPGA